MNQIIAAIMLFGIVTAVFAPLILESGSQIFSRSSSISDVMKSSRLQAGQIMVATNAHQDGSTITVYLSNIGSEDIRFHAVLVDGIRSRFALSQDSIRADALAAGELGILEVDGTGDTVQTVAASGKLFEFFIP